MLAGRYPSDEFAELRPRLVWDRVTGTLTRPPGAQRLAVTSGGTIPDRGLFGVFLARRRRGAAGRRVGELDEEMVYESRVGDVFTLGTTSWRIEDITHDRVLVSPAPGQPGRLPFWNGDALGRPAELGGRSARSPARSAGSTTTAVERPGSTARARRWAAGNLLAYLAEQREATGPRPARPHARRRALPRRARRLANRAALPLRRARARAVGAGGRRPAARALRRGRRRRCAADDGIVLRIPETDAGPARAPS